MNTHLKQLWAAMKLPEKLQKSYKFCRGLDIRVTHIMHPDLLCPGVVTTILHLSADPAPIIREDAVCRLYLVKLCQIVFQAVFQHLRHDHFTVASFRFGRIDVVLSVQTLIVLLTEIMCLSKSISSGVRASNSPTRNPV